MSVDPVKVVASFDSASVLHGATVAALARQNFPNLGSSALQGAAVRVAGRLPWPILRPIYARIGGAEGLRPDLLGDVDMEAVAAMFADAYDDSRNYPAVVLGSSNGAMTHLAAAMQVPWLPGTVLVPVHRVADPDRPDLALAFGKKVAPPFLRASPNVVLHQMHDAAQDALMVARMTYFRTKWSALPAAYQEFLETRLAPGAPLFLVNDQSSWPVTRVSDRHVFQSGGRGGLTPDEYLERPHTPPADSTAPEAEWGAEPAFNTAVRDWCALHSHLVVEIIIDGPQEASHVVATILRRWTVSRGGAADHLLVPSFVLGDPWRTFELGRTQFWTFFPVEDALRSLEHHLKNSAPYKQVDVLLFQHGASSPRLAPPAAFGAAIRDNGATPRLLAVRPDKSPRDIGSMGRYGRVLRKEPAADLPWVPLSVDAAIHGLSATTSERGRLITSATPEP